MVSINFAQRIFQQSIGGLLLGLLLLFGGSVGASSANATESRAVPVQTRLIIQGRDLPSARAAVRDAGAEITQELKIIRAVVANVSGLQREQIEADAGVHRVWADAQTRLQVTPGLPQPD